MKDFEIGFDAGMMCASIGRLAAAIDNMQPLYNSYSMSARRMMHGFRAALSVRLANQK
jgi:hypothetical protein